MRAQQLGNKMPLFPSSPPPPSPTQPLWGDCPPIAILGPPKRFAPFGGHTRTTGAAVELRAENRFQHLNPRHWVGLHQHVGTPRPSGGGRGWSTLRPLCGQTSLPEHPFEGVPAQRPRVGQHSRDHPLTPPTTGGGGAYVHKANTADSDSNLAFWAGNVVYFELII